MSDGMEMIPKEAIERLLTKYISDIANENAEYKTTLLYNRAGLMERRLIDEKARQAMMFLASVHLDVVDMPVYVLKDPTLLPVEYHELWLQEVQVDND